MKQLELKHFDISDHSDHTLYSLRNAPGLRIAKWHGNMTEPARFEVYLPSHKFERTHEDEATFERACEVLCSLAYHASRGMDLEGVPGRVVSWDGTAGAPASYRVQRPSGVVAVHREIAEAATDWLASVAEWVQPTPLPAGAAVTALANGVKHDEHKPRPELLPPRALLSVSEVLAYGARKYAPDNWRKVPDAHTRYVGAALRHVLAHLTGERLDPESGKPHLAHAVCSLLFALEFDL